MTLDEALLVLTTKLHYLPNALTLALGINHHMVGSSKHAGEDPSAGTAASNFFQTTQCHGLMVRQPGATCPRNPRGVTAGLQVN